MEILVDVKKLLKVSGLLFNYSDRIWYKIYRYAWIFFLIYFIIPEILYCIKNFNKINKLTDVLVDLCFVISATGKITCLFYHNKSIFKLISRLEENIDKRKIVTNAKHYLEAEKFNRNITRIFYGIIFATIIAFISLPLLLVLVDYMTGNLTANSWQLPFGVVLFYDSVSSPGFEITYFIGIFASFATGGGLALIDTLFFGLTVHVTAVFKDLQDMIKDLDKNALNLKDIEHSNNSDDNDCTKHGCEEFRNYYRQKLVKCIDFHEFSLRKMYRLQVVTDDLIFLQYFTSTTMLCLVVFQAAHTLNSGIFLKNFLFLIVLSSQLFIYTWFGHQLTFEGQQVADAIYQTNWYVHKRNVQKLHYFMISRAQSTKYLMGLKVIRCNLESFSNVLSATASAFALLQSVLQKT